MKIHHLNCGSFCTLSIPYVNLKRFEGVCHCLLIESANKLIMVDSGYSTFDIENPVERLGVTSLAMGSMFSKEETAIFQIEKMGFHRNDVTDIILTHADPDHIGGIFDFPNANIHIYAEEYQVVEGLQSRNPIQNHRYRRHMWSHNVNWKTYSLTGDRWFGLSAVKQLDGLPPEILLVPLLGHSIGHCGIAVKSEAGWLLHAGDSYFSPEDLKEKKPFIPSALEIFQRALAFDNSLRLENQKILRDLKKEHPKDLRVFCSHDKNELLSFIKP